MRENTLPDMTKEVILTEIPQRLLIGMIGDQRLNKMLKINRMEAQAEAIRSI